MKFDTFLYTEKYRPKNLEELIVPQDILVKFKNGISTNMLFTGAPGSGKTSAAKAIVKHFGYPYIYINASKETSVDIVRNIITDFCSTRSIMDNDGMLKVVILDECLYEEEEVRIGTLDNYECIKLKNLEVDKFYNCPSMNIKTGELENDVCKIISEKETEVYEVELEDGRTIIVTDNHPFMIKDADGNIIEKTIKDGLNSTDTVIVF